MASCMVAVDRAHKHNGALNVLKGSHKLGRLNHAREATAGEVRRISFVSPSILPNAIFCLSCLITVLQEVARSEMCADRDRVAIAEQVCERVVCSLAPGDALFFDCNLLHCSAPNTAQDDPRWVRLYPMTRSSVSVLGLQAHCLCLGVASLSLYYFRPTVLLAHTGADMLL